MNDSKPGNGTQPLLSMRGVKKYFDISPPFLNRVLERKPTQHLRAVDGLDLDIPQCCLLCVCVYGVCVCVCACVCVCYTQ